MHICNLCHIFEAEWELGRYSDDQTIWVCYECMKDGSTKEKVELWALEGMKW